MFCVSIETVIIWMDCLYLRSKGSQIVLEGPSLLGIQYARHILFYQQNSSLYQGNEAMYNEGCVFIQCYITTWLSIMTFIEVYNN